MDARGIICEGRRIGAIGIFYQILVIGATDRDDCFRILRSHGYEPRNPHHRDNRHYTNWSGSHVNSCDRENYDRPCKGQDPNTPVYRDNHNNRLRHPKSAIQHNRYERIGE